MTDLPKYHSFPPLTPHKTKEEAARIKLLCSNGIMTELDFSGYDTSQVTDFSALGYKRCESLVAFPPLTPHQPEMSTRDSDFNAKVKDAIEMVGDIDLCFDTDFSILEAMDVETLANHLKERARIYAADQSAAKAWFAAHHKPTPTIPQMTVLAVVFVGGLMYKKFVWGY
jgi:surface protein